MLNPTDEKFLAATLRGATPEEAAIAAGLSEKTARVAGARLRKKPAIVEALAAIGISTPGAPAAVPKATHSEPDPEDEPIDDLPITTNSMEFYEAIMANPRVPLSKRMEAAKQLMPYQNAKIGESGKKKTKQEGAKELAEEGNTFGARKAPKLHAVTK